MRWAPAVAAMLIAGLTCLTRVSLLAQAGQPAHAPLTAGDVVDRIKSHVGVPWHRDTVDTFKAGDGKTRITGVAVTMMATLDVLQRAVEAGANLVITHEPTFYDHKDAVEPLAREKDAVLGAKMAFITQHHLVVWRFHDHWHLRQPDGIQAGMLRVLGWPTPQGGDSPALVTVPETTLTALAADVRTRLGAHALRVVGRGDMRVTRLALLPGAAGFEAHRAALQHEGVQVLVIGEAREWETVEYVDDATAAGQSKGLVIIGHIPSEQAGMEDCATWLKSFVTEVPVTFVPARDPFWQPH
jgi:putative NIF3 family GTP cyclohydrolase 1 type 2